MRADKSSGEPGTGPRSVGRGLRVRRGKGTSRLDQKSQEGNVGSSSKALF